MPQNLFISVISYLEELNKNKGKNGLKIINTYQIELKKP